MKAATTYLERAAKQAWHGWANYMQHTFCGSCGDNHYCGRADRRRRWICLDCFDQGER